MEVKQLPSISARLQSGSLTSATIVIDADSLSWESDSTLEVGVCWSTRENPLITDSLRKTTYRGKMIVVNIGRSLTPGNKYYARAYVKGKSGIKYSTSFPVLAPKPKEAITSAEFRKVVANSENVVSDSYVAEVTLPLSKLVIESTYQDEAQFEITFDSKNNADALLKGICYSERKNPSVAFNTVQTATKDPVFKGSIKYLMPNKSYYARSYIITAKDTLYGDIQTLKTNKIDVPVVGEVLPMKVKGNSVYVATSVLRDGGASASERGVCWSKEGSPTVDDSHVIDSLASGLGKSGAQINGLEMNTPYFLRSYASNGVGVAYGPIAKIFTSVGEIGDIYAGGIIFYLDETGRHGAVCATKDQATSIHWVGAVLLCKELELNGYSDWSLPTKEELDLMYTNLYLSNIGELSNYYWSGTESDYNDAWYWRMNYGSPYYNFKGNVLNVRAVRHF